MVVYSIRRGYASLLEQTGDAVEVSSLGRQLARTCGLQRRRDIVITVLRRDEYVVKCVAIDG